MQTFRQSLQKGFKQTSNGDYWSFVFGDDGEYELAFEPLFFDGQHYVALYKNKELLTEKVVIKPGYEKQI